MAMLLGLVAPTAGSGTVLGHSLEDPSAYLGRVGALVESPALWAGLTGAETSGSSRPSPVVTLPRSPAYWNWWGSASEQRIDSVSTRSA